MYSFNFAAFMLSQSFSNSALSAVQQISGMEGVGQSESLLHSLFALQFTHPQKPPLVSQKFALGVPPTIVEHTVAF